MVALLRGVPVVEPHLLPECHALGEAPEGYAEKDEQCSNCRDKFSCLPASIEKKLGPVSLEVDQEVFALARGTLTYSDGIRRMLLRHARGAAPIPKALRHTAPIVVAPAGPRVKREWHARAGTLDPEVMLAQLQGVHSYKDRGVRIGQPFVLRVGMQLVRRKSNAERIVLLRENGFEALGVIYPSLSTAAIALEKRSVSGNDFFHVKHKQVEIRDENSKVLFSGGQHTARSDL